MKIKDLSNLDYNNNKFIIKENKTYSTLSQKYLKDTINNYFKDNKKLSDDLLKYIFNNRELTIQNNLYLK